MTKEQLGDLILSSQEQMYRIAKTIMFSDEDCAEAMSEAIVKAFTKIGTLREDAYAKTWLMRILINECYNICREKNVSYPYEVNLMEAEASEDYSELYLAIHALPDELGVTITLHYIEGYKVKEIASIMRVTEDIVKKRLMQGRAKLKSILNNEEEAM